MNIENYISSGIIEQYVLGICNEEDEHELTLLRVAHPQINEAIVKFEQELEATFLANSDTTVQLPTLDSMLPTLASLPITNTLKHTDIASKPMYRWLMVAAVLLLAVSAFYNYLLYQKNEQQALALKKIVPVLPQVSLPLKDFDVLKNPTIIPVAMMGQGYHAICRCTLFWDRNTGKAYVMIHHLINSGSTHDFQLWAVVNGQNKYLGKVDETIRSQFVEVNGVPNNSTEFIVTLEKAGIPTQPDDDIFLKGKI